MKILHYTKLPVYFYYFYSTYSVLLVLLINEYHTGYDIQYCITDIKCYDTGTWLYYYDTEHDIILCYDTRASATSTIINIVPIEWYHGPVIPCSIIVIIIN